MRLRTIRLIYFLIISLVIFRLGYWQVVKADDLSVMGEDQRVSKKEIKAGRGVIYFSDKSILASNQPSYLLFGQPKATSDKESFSQKIAEVLFDVEQKRAPLKIATTEAELKISQDEKKQEFRDLKDSLARTIDQPFYWVSLNTQVDMETKKRLEGLGFGGLGYDESLMRFYPEGSSSAHLLGFVSSDAYGNDTGYFGVEGFYNGELKGKKGSLSQEKDALGIPILIGKFINREAEEGKSLVLNVDRTVQHIVEEKLKKGLEKYGAKGASAIVMDPQTGGILAMASYPNYDPSLPKYFPKDNFKNPITVDGYEPGSTFKVLVAAAALNEGLIESDTLCDICGSPLNLGGFTIRTWNNQYQANSSMTDVIVHSDNIGMVFIARKLGLDKFYTYLEKFGFGKVTGVDLQDESSPTLRPKDSWREIDLATSSFGQGISVTALQVVRAVSVIANGGKLMEPHVVSEIVDQNDKVFKVKPRVISQPINAEAAKAITEMMVRAVEDGEAKFFKPKGYKVAGKTGTAQIPIKGHYDENKTIASFVGFAPADDPKFVMLVRYNEPSTSIYGSETAAPTFFEIAREMLVYYGIAPTD